MSLLQKQKDLEDAPDSFLQQLLQQGNPQYPGWLVAAVADQRADFRQRQKNAEALRQAEQPTMVQNVSTKLGGIPDADPNQMGDPSLATGIAGGMAAAGGGVIRGYFEGDLVGDEEDEEEEVALTAEEMLYEAVPGLVESAGSELARMDALQNADYRDWVRTQPRGADLSPEAFRDRPIKYGGLEGRPDLAMDEATRKILRQAGVRGGGSALMDMATAYDVEQREEYIKRGGSLEEETAEDTRRRGILSAIQEAGTDNPEYATYLSTVLDTNKSIDELPSLEAFQETPGYALQAGFSSTPLTPQEADQEAGETDDTGTGSSQDFIDAWLADRQAERGAARGRFERVLGAGERVIDDYAKARAPDEDDRAIYRRERQDLNLALSQARRVADERGENAEERQEIYDNLVGELQSQDRRRRSSRKRRQQVQATRARGVGLGSLGDSSGRERMATFIDDMRDEEIEYENQLRTDTREDAERVLQNLTSLQNYEEKTGTDLDDAVLANSRGKTTLLGDLLDTDETLEQELTEMSLDLYGKALSPSASLDAVDVRAASAEEAARNARTVQEFERYMFKPESWEDTMNFFDTRLQLLDQDPDLANDPARKARIEENLRRLFNDMANMNVRSLMDQTRTGMRGETQLTAETLTYLKSGSPTGAVDTGDVGR